MKESSLEKMRAFDKNGVIKTEIDSAMKRLKDFRVKYRFAENPESIETLDPDDIFRVKSDEVGDFFHWLEYYLKPIGHLTIHGSYVYRQIRDQFEDFKELLHVTVDPKKSLAQKVDAPWDGIRGLGGTDISPRRLSSASTTNAGMYCQFSRLAIWSISSTKS